MKPDRIERDIVIAAPIERVWKVLTAPEHVGVWFGQGLGYIKGSFMTGHGFWTVMGALLIVIGVWRIVGGIRRRQNQPDH